MSQEEMMVGIKTVAQGLEALKNELMASNNPSGQNTMQPEEKQSMLQKTLDMTELGLGEAQVRSFVFIVNLKVPILLVCHNRLKFLL